MAFANPIAWWALAPVVLAAAALAWFAYRRFGASPRRRRVLGAVRFLTLLLLVVLLMRPVARVDTQDARGAVVPILVDTSRSMSIEDADGRRRVDHARDLVDRELLPALGPRFSVELLSFGERLGPVAPADLGATGRRSDLATALLAVRERYRGRPIAGIVLLSDGGDTSGAAAASITADTTPPVFAVGVGSETVGRDREVLSVTAAEAVLDDSQVDLAVSAVSRGSGTAPIELRLLENGRPIEVRRAMPAADGSPIREVFHVAPARGAPTIYTVEIPSAAGEVVPENNARSVLIQPPARPRRVLLVEGAPGFEHSFLKRALGGDSGLELDSVVRKGVNDQGADTFYIQAARSRADALRNGFPESPEQLFVYDAVVLANVEASQLPRAQLETLRRFVAGRGGGLLVMGARSFGSKRLLDSPIEDVLPLDLTDRGGVVQTSMPAGVNRLALTAAGETHPVMRIAASLDETRRRWSDVPALSAAAALGSPRAGATVLAATGGAGGARALVAVQRFGEGRSMVFTGEASWRWRMMLPSSDRSYERFWRQAVRWLALPATDPVHLTVPAGAAAGDTLLLRVAARNGAFEPQPDAVVDVRVTAPDGRIEQITAAAGGGDDRAGGFAAAFTSGQPGIYRVAAEARRAAGPLGAASTSLLVGGVDLEMTDPRLNRAVLQRISAVTGGRLLAESELGQLPAILRDRVPAAVLSVRRDLWHNAWSFAAIAVLLGAEWILRRRWGLR